MMQLPCLRSKNEVVYIVFMVQMGLVRNLEFLPAASV